MSIYTQEELVGHTKSLLARFTFIRHYYTLWSNLTDHSAVFSKSVKTALTASLHEIIHSAEKSLSPTNHPASDVTIHRKLYSQTPATPKFLSVLEGFTRYSSFVRHVYTISTLFARAKESLDLIESRKSSKDIFSVLQFELEALWIEETEMLIPTRSYLNVCIFALLLCRQTITYLTLNFLWIELHLFLNQARNPPPNLSLYKIALSRLPLQTPTSHSHF